MNPSSISTFAGQGLVVLGHQLVPDLVEHPPRGLVVDAELALKMLRRDAASSAGDEIHGVEPQVEQGRGFVEDRPSGRVDVVAAGGASPRLTPLRRGVSLWDAAQGAFAYLSQICRAGRAMPDFQKQPLSRHFVLLIQPRDTSRQGGNFARGEAP